LSWAVTAALSRNKIKEVNGALYNYYDPNDYTKYTIVNTQFQNTDIAYSPSFVGSSEIAWLPFKGAEAALISKYVGMQYLDNTSNGGLVAYPALDAESNRTIDSYFVNNVRLRYSFQTKAVKNIGISLLVYNIFSEKYVTNGATYPDIESGQVVNYNYYFPQAPRNFFLSLSLGF
jgi:iron complex outermembrane recepter protein